MAKNWLWKDPYEEGKKRKKRIFTKAAGDRFRTLKSVAQHARDAGEKGEALARMAGKGIGFMVGGAAGAGIGDLLAGGLYDLKDKRSETKMDMENYTYDGVDYSDGGRTLDINRRLDRANDAANTRHLTSPIKSYLSALTLAELGGGGDMGIVDKSTFSGMDMLKNSRWGQAGAAKAAESLNILDIIGKKGGAEAAEKTLLKGGFTKGLAPSAATAAPVINQAINSNNPMGPNLSANPNLPIEEPLLSQGPMQTPPEVLAKRKAIQVDQNKTADAMELFEKKRKINRDQMHFYARGIEGDPSKRAALVEKYNSNELKNMYENNINPNTGDPNKSIWDSIMGGLKKDPVAQKTKQQLSDENNQRIARTVFDPNSKLSKANTEFANTSVPVKGSENAHKTIENLQNFLDGGGFSVDKAHSSAQLGPKLNIDQNIMNLENITNTNEKAKLEQAMLQNIGDREIRGPSVNTIPKVQREPYKPVGENRIQDFVPNPIERYDPDNPETWTDDNLGRFWDNQKDSGIDPANINKNFDTDDYLIQNIQELEKNVPVINNQISDIQGYKQEDLGIMARDLKSRGFSDKEIELKVQEWTMKQYGNPAFTDRTVRMDSLYPNYSGNYSDGQYHEGVIGDQGDWQSLNFSDGSSGAASQFDNYTASGQDYMNAQQILNKAPYAHELETITQGKANDMIEQIMSKGSSGDSTVEELYSLYNHGRMEGWSDARMNEIGKLIRTKNKN